MICKICYDEFGEEDLFLLSNCSDYFHKDCLQMYLRTEIQDSRFPLKCPGDKCKKDIQNDDLQNILDNKELDKYYEFTFN